ncbi:hypothetical protein N7540_003295 [Penicillium herquei]|nr:hypothetical protein N7540_003295 [Penicillium herquei]
MSDRSKKGYLWVLPKESQFRITIGQQTITLAVKLKPLSEVEIKEDNCSIYQRFNGHCFCRVRGVHVFIKLHGPLKAVVDSLSADKQKYVQELLSIFPLRLPVLDDIEWSDCHIGRSDEGKAGYVI